MKFCGKCGAELKDDAKFCASCGEPCNSTPKVGATKNSEPKSKAPFIGVVIALIVALMVGFSVVRWYNSPEQQALRAIEASDYATALNIVSRNQTVSHSEKLISKLNKRIDELESGYEKEKLEYEFVETELNAIEQLGISSISERLITAKKNTYDLYCTRTYETVYLRTSLVQTNWNSAYTSTTTYNWSYDDTGRLTGYGYGYEYPDSEDSNMYTGYLYTYDDNGRIIAITIADGDANVAELTAVYDEDGYLTEYQGSYDGEMTSVRFGYDKNGNFASRILEDSDGEISQKIEYVYDENGTMRDRTIYIMSYVINAKFDNNGKVCEQSMQLDGEYQYRYFLDYNEHGHLCNQIIYSEDNAEPSSTLEVEYTYDSEGRITKIYLEEDGRSASGTFQGSDTYRTLTLSGRSSSYGDVTIVLEYDDAGNLVKQAQYVNGTLQSEAVYTYISLELPLSYEQPNTNNPIYVIN